MIHALRKRNGLGTLEVGAEAGSGTNSARGDRVG